MTVTIALKDEKNKRIILGADRQGTINDISLGDFGCKMLKVEIPLNDGGIDSMYMAISGSTYLHSYLWNVFKAPVYDLKYELIDQKLIIEDKGELDSESHIIIVHGEDIYSVYYNLSIVKNPQKYAVGGVGYKIALSVLENNLEFHNDMDYKDIVKEALYTTGKLNIYCNTDYDVLVIDY